MRRLLILFLLLCLHGLARGQTQYEYRYWFDDDITTAEKGNATSDAWHIEVDLSHLTESFHTIHMQVTDEKGVSSSPMTRSFFLSRDGKFLKKGFHWFDDETQAISVESDIQGTLTFDVTELPEGYHTLHYQVLREDGQYSQIETRGFFKIQKEQTSGYLTFFCYVDGALFKMERILAEDNQASMILDVSELPIGFHRLQVRALTENGTSTSIRESYFLRNAMDSEINALSCVFSIDGQLYKTVENGVQDGLFHCDLDVASLSEGMHKMSYYLTNGQGAQTTVKSQYFIKIPIGGNSIKKYQYWLNNNDEMAHMVDLGNTTDPFLLISLLPVEQQPLSSKLFHFEVKDGQPKIYAKNSFHIRFFDAASRYTDATEDYIDYNMSQELTDVDELLSGVRKTIDFPAENTIKWFSLQADRGDCLEFKTDKPCTLQLFAPSNAEVYNVCGSAAVSYDGIYAEETGTYYLALHDVTAKNGTEIYLNYLHIEKYTVLSHSVTEMGVLPTAHVMSMTGNGLDNALYATLRMGNHTIVSDTIIASSKAEAKVLFAFTGEEQYGSYDLVVHFDDGESTKDFVVKDAMTLAAPCFGNIDIAISDPRSVADPYPVSIKVTNTSNLTYSDIPFFMAYDPVERISKMSYENFFIGVDSALVANGLKDSYIIDDFNLGGKTARLVAACIPFMQAGESRTYVFGFKANNHENYKVYAWTGTPWNLYATETWESIENLAAQQGGIVLPGTTTADVPENHVTTGYYTSPFFYSLNAEDNAITQNSSSVHISAKDMLFYILKDILEALRKALATDADLTRYWRSDNSTSGNTTGYDFSGSNTNTGSSGGYTGGISSSGTGHALNNYYRNNSDGHYGHSTGVYFGNLSDPIRKEDLLFAVPSEIVDAVNKVSSFLDGFVREAVLGKGIIEWAKHQANQWNPGDPNDILGYTAPSGSKDVGKGVTDGYYTIEFENDPEIANAAAHTITVRDTLDSRVFNLNSFEPTGIKLGDVMTTVEKDTQFPITFDLRPAINVIAQADLDYNPQTGIAVWKITSLDPMTLEETHDAMQGVLPVNVNGNGQGEVMFNIQFKNEMEHGTEISNRAGIVFDNEGLIMTPTWVNVVDTIAPTSEITSYKVKYGCEVTLEWTGEDVGSGIWCYDIYTQTAPNGLWYRVREGVTEQTATLTMTEEGEYGFCVVAIDMAGNRENKLMKNELADDEQVIIDADGIDAPVLSPKGNGIMYDLSGRRVNGHRTGVYVKDGRVQLIVR